MAYEWLITLFAGLLTTLLGLVTTSRVLRRWVFFPISVILLCKVAFIDSLHIATPSDRQAASTHSGLLLMRCIELLVCSDDLYLEFIRIRDGPIKIKEQGFGKRMKWAAALLLSPRGPGWNWRVRGTPPPLPMSLSRLVYHYIIRCAFFSIICEAGPTVIAFLGPSRTLSGPLVFIHAILLFSVLDMLHSLICVLWILFGATSVEECPHLYGDIKYSMTLKRVWGSVWQQCLRRPATILADRTSTFLGLGPDKYAIGTFIVLGMFHALPAYAASSGVVWYRTFVFFAIQPLGLLFERHVLQIDRWKAPIRLQPEVLRARSEDQVSKTNGGTKAPFSTEAPAHSRTSVSLHPKLEKSHTLHRWLGYAWVISWFILTGPLYASDLLASGFYENGGSTPVFPILRGLRHLTG